MDSVSQDQIAVPIICSTCGQVGSVVTEITDGKRRNVVSVSNGFHLGDVVGPSDDPELICDHCDGSTN